MSEATQNFSTPLEGRELIEAIKRQVEYYFSKENLRSDSYLISQMNSELYVPVKVIAGFNIMRNLTEDLDIIVSAMRECKNVRLNGDETMLKPNITSQRSTLILRDIPSNTDPKEINALFEEKFGKLEIKSDIGDCWYVNLENDENTLAALDHLRQQKFRGEPVKARIKTENTLKTLQANVVSNRMNDIKTSVIPPPNVFPMFVQPTPWVQNYPVPPMDFDPNIAQQNFRQSRHPHQLQPQRQSHHKQHLQPQSQSLQQNFSQIPPHIDTGNRRGNNPPFRRRKDFTGIPSNNPQIQPISNNQVPPMSQTVPTRGGRGMTPSNPNNSRGGPARGGGFKKRRNGANPPSPPNLGEEAQFPPLVSQKRPDEIRSYSRQEVIDIITQIKDVEKPATPQGCEAVIDQANYELEVTKEYPKTGPKKSEQETSVTNSQGVE